MSILGDGEALWHKGLEASTVPVLVPETGTITGTVPAAGEFTVPVWAPETGTVLGVTVPVWAPETGTVLGLLYLFEYPKQERYCGDNLEGDCQRWQEIEKICRMLQR